jgi:DNA-binding transcriptional MerR regulator/methylmalonyl-CoA mutase cobalamin-binding subunit
VSQSSPKDRHPIRVAAARSGVSVHLIRSWERRYGAVHPDRSPSGQRLYSDRDIRRLHLIRLLIAAGRRIGDVAALDDEEMESHLLADGRALVARAADRSSPVARSTQDGRSAKHLILQCLEAIEALDEDLFEQEISEGAVAMGDRLLRRLVILPLMHEVGRLWQTGGMRIVHEHLASAVVRSYLGASLRRARPSADAWQLLVATPTAQLHEIGTLAAAVEAAEAGCRVTYLGPNLPAEEIAAAARARMARAVLLGLVYPARDARTTDELRQLREMLGPKPAFLVGGASAESYQEMLEEIGAEILDSIDALSHRLERLTDTGA